MMPELASRIGDEAEYTAPDELGAAAIRYFAFATEDDNPLYRDAAFATQTRHGGLIAPPTLVCETNQFTEGQVNLSEYLGHDWHLPLKDMRVIRGGNDYEFFQPVRPDDRVTVRWKILDISEKAGSGVRPRIFVVSQATYRNQHGALLATNTETMIYAP